jgi:large subunit ribosomal protein L21
MYAIIRAGGRQYRVREGDRILIERETGDAGDSLTFGDVLLLESDGAISVGAPTVAGASVAARIAEQTRGPKLIGMKYKNKTRSRRKHGHRQHLTRIEIVSITPGA